MAKNESTLMLEEQPNQKVHWGFWVGVVFFVAVIIAMIWIGLFVTQKMATGDSSPVTSIVISGEMTYTNQVDIEQAIDVVNLGNFFHVDVNQVQKRVLALPWVYSVSVRKKWPNELKIYVVDQTPVAYWNGDFLINHEGVAFQANIKRITHTLPSFYGPEGTENIALENYVNLSKQLEYSDLSIDELMLSERFSWKLTLDDGIALNLGRTDRVQRIQRFMEVYSQIKAHQKPEQQIDYVDLRYGTGLAVGWKSSTEKERV